MTITIHADEIRPGDLLNYGGRPHRTTDVSWHAGWAFPVAMDGAGWAIALGHHLITVSRG
jgi:hypothetical protein